MRAERFDLREVARLEALPLHGRRDVEDADERAPFGLQGHAHRAAELAPVTAQPGVLLCVQDLWRAHSGGQTRDGLAQRMARGAHDVLGEAACGDQVQLARLRCEQLHGSAACTHGAHGDVQKPLAQLGARCQPGPRVVHRLDAGGRRQSARDCRWRAAPPPARHVELDELGLECAAPVDGVLETQALGGQDDEVDTRKTLA